LNRITKLLLLKLTLFLSLSIGSVSAVSAEQVFKIASLAPQGSAWLTRIQKGAERITKETDGRVKFKFFGGGIQGTDKKVLRKMRSGQLHGGAFAAGSLASRSPSVLLYGLPFLFNNEQEVSAVRAELDSYVEQTLRDAGLVTFGFAGGGFAQIMSNSKVLSVDDLRGKKVWIPEGDTISYKGMENFGLAPVTLPITDVLTGLQTGLVDVVASSATGALVLQWHTKVNHLSTMPVSYLYGVLGIDQKFFKKLSTEDQATVDRIFREVYIDMEKRGMNDNDSATQALVGSGVTVVEPAPGALEELQSRSRDLWKKVAADGELPKPQLDQIYEILARTRGE